MGHWAAKADNVSSGYDGARTATELAYKAIVASNVRGGWRPVSHGEIPKKAIVPFIGDMSFTFPPAAPAVPSSAKREEATANAEADPEDKPSVPRYVFPFGVSQVLNERTKTVHLTPGEGTACNAWKCGTRETPAQHAEFAIGTKRWSPQLNPVRFCLGCYGDRGLKRLGATLRIGGEDLQGSDSSSSESETVSDSEIVS